CYGRFECWPDNSRVDSLYCLLLVAGTALLLDGRARWSGPLSGLCYGLSMLTKQPAAVLMALSAVHAVLVTKQWQRPVCADGVAVATVTADPGAAGGPGPTMRSPFPAAVPARPAFVMRLCVRGVFFLPVTLPCLCWMAWAGPRSAIRRGVSYGDVARRAPWS